MCQLKNTIYLCGHRSVLQHNLFCLGKRISTTLGCVETEEFLRVLQCECHPKIVRNLDLTKPENWRAKPNSTDFTPPALPDLLKAGADQGYCLAHVATNHIWGSQYVQHFATLALNKRTNIHGVLLQWPRYSRNQTSLPAEAEAVGRDTWRHMVLYELVAPFMSELDAKQMSGDIFSWSPDSISTLHAILQTYHLHSPPDTDQRVVLRPPQWINMEWPEFIYQIGLWYRTLGEKLDIELKKALWYVGQGICKKVSHGPNDQKHLLDFFFSQDAEDPAKREYPFKVAWRPRVDLARLYNLTRDLKCRKVLIERHVANLGKLCAKGKRASLVTEPKYDTVCDECQRWNRGGSIEIELRDPTMFQGVIKGRLSFACGPKNNNVNARGGAAPSSNSQEEVRAWMDREHCRRIWSSVDDGETTQRSVSGSSAATSRLILEAGDLDASISGSEASPLSRKAMGLSVPLVRCKEKEEADQERSRETWSTRRTCGSVSDGEDALDCIQPDNPIAMSERTPGLHDVQARDLSLRGGGACRDITAVARDIATRPDSTHEARITVAGRKRPRDPSRSPEIRGKRKPLEFQPVDPTSLLDSQQEQLGAAYISHLEDVAWRGGMQTSTHSMEEVLQAHVRVVLENYSKEQAVKVEPRHGPYASRSFYDINGKEIVVRDMIERRYLLYFYLCADGLVYNDAFAISPEYALSLVNQVGNFIHKTWGYYPSLIRPRYVEEYDKRVAHANRGLVRMPRLGPWKSILEEFTGYDASYFRPKDIVVDDSMQTRHLMAQSHNTRVVASESSSVPRVHWSVSQFDCIEHKRFPQAMMDEYAKHEAAMWAHQCREWSRSIKYQPFDFGPMSTEKMKLRRTFDGWVMVEKEDIPEWAILPFGGGKSMSARRTAFINLNALCSLKEEKEGKEPKVKPVQHLMYPEVPPMVLREGECHYGDSSHDMESEDEWELVLKEDVPEWTLLPLPDGENQQDRRLSFAALNRLFEMKERREDKARAEASQTYPKLPEAGLRGGDVEGSSYKTETSHHMLSASLPMLHSAEDTKHDIERRRRLKSRSIQRRQQAVEMKVTGHLTVPRSRKRVFERLKTGKLTLSEHSSSSDSVGVEVKLLMLKNEYQALVRDYEDTETFVAQFAATDPAMALRTVTKMQAVWTKIGRCQESFIKYLNASDNFEITDYKNELWEDIHDTSTMKLKLERLSRHFEEMLGRRNDTAAGSVRVASASRAQQQGDGIAQPTAGTSESGILKRRLSEEPCKDAEDSEESRVVSLTISSSVDIGVSIDCRANERSTRKSSNASTVSDEVRHAFFAGDDDFGTLCGAEDATTQRKADDTAHDKVPTVEKKTKKQRLGKEPCNDAEEAKDRDACPITPSTSKNSSVKTVNTKVRQSPLVKQEDLDTSSLPPQVDCSITDSWEIITNPVNVSKVNVPKDLLAIRMAELRAAMSRNRNSNQTRHWREALKLKRQPEPTSLYDDICGILDEYVDADERTSGLPKPTPRSVGLSQRERLESYRRVIVEIAADGIARTTRGGHTAGTTVGPQGTITARGTGKVEKTTIVYALGTPIEAIPEAVTVPLENEKTMLCSNVAEPWKCLVNLSRSGISETWSSSHSEFSFAGSESSSFGGDMKTQHARCRADSGIDLLLGGPALRCAEELNSAQADMHSLPKCQKLSIISKHDLSLGGMSNAMAPSRCDKVKWIVGPDDDGSLIDDMSTPRPRNIRQKSRLVNGSVTLRGGASDVIHSQVDLVLRHVLDGTNETDATSSPCPIPQSTFIKQKRNSKVDQNQTFETTDTVDMSVAGSETSAGSSMEQLIRQLSRQTHSDAGATEPPEPDSDVSEDHLGNFMHMKDPLSACRVFWPSDEKTKEETAAAPATKSFKDPFQDDNDEAGSSEARPQRSHMDPRFSQRFSKEQWHAEKELSRHTFRSADADIDDTDVIEGVNIIHPGSEKDRRIVTPEAQILPKTPSTPPAPKRRRRNATEMDEHRYHMTPARTLKPVDRRPSGTALAEEAPKAERGRSRAWSKGLRDFGGPLKSGHVDAAVGLDVGKGKGKSIAFFIPAGSSVEGFAEKGSDFKVPVETVAGSLDNYFDIEARDEEDAALADNFKHIDEAKMQHAFIEGQKAMERSIRIASAAMNSTIVRALAKHQTLSKDNAAAQQMIGTLSKDSLRVVGSWRQSPGQVNDLQKSVRRSGEDLTMSMDSLKILKSWKRKPIGGVFKLETSVDDLD